MEKRVWSVEWWVWLKVRWAVNGVVKEVLDVAVVVGSNEESTVGIEIWEGAREVVELDEQVAK